MGYPTPSYAACPVLYWPAAQGSLASLTTITVGTTGTRVIPSLLPSTACPHWMAPEQNWLWSPVRAIWSLGRPSHTLLCSIKLQTRLRYSLSKVSTRDNPACCQRECAGFLWPYLTTRLRSGYWFQSGPRCQHSLRGFFICTVWL